MTFAFIAIGWFVFIGIAVYGFNKSFPKEMSHHEKTVADLKARIASSDRVIQEAEEILRKRKAS